MNKRKVCVVTGTRAEYGSFYPILKRIQSSEKLELQLIVSTMHLSEEFGLSYKQIEQDGFKIDDKIENLLSADTKSSVVKSSGLAMILLSDSFKRLSPDVVLILGDRYETHAAATTAMLMNIPIAHIHGGEITEGAVDEQIRHSITKMSALHFASTEAYRKRIIQMGENPANVITSGAPSIDNILNFKLLTKPQLESSLSWKFSNKNALFTYHPVTLEQTDIAHDMDKIFQVLSGFDFNILFTYANSDDSGRLINNKIEAFCEQNPQKYKVVKSLGQLRYLSSMNYVDLVIGNSSSGIIEAASFQKPVVNIGNRQKGRLQSGNIVNCDIGSLEPAIKEALSREFNEKCKVVKNVYGCGKSAEIIVNTIEKHEFSLIKKFVDLD